ncbi:putative methyltransferase [Forsythia ovata]|uniref:Methyltransferase n=1 Tax=Forsythia ovata TaxID=205694 RepID=A0ABD1UYU0_9LAMI
MSNRLSVGKCGKCDDLSPTVIINEFSVGKEEPSQPRPPPRRQARPRWQSPVAANLHLAASRPPETVPPEIWLGPEKARSMASESDVEVTVNENQQPQPKIQIYPTSTGEISSFWREKYERDAKKYRDIFYKRHQDKVSCF